MGFDSEPNMALASDRWTVTPRDAAASTANLLHRYLLLLRFALFNIVAAGLVSAVYLRGWLNNAFVGYTGWCSVAIVSVFVFGLILCTAKIWRTSVELNDVRAGTPRPTSRAGKYLASIAGRPAESRAVTTNLLRLRMTHYISGVRYVANTLVFLGLVGTVIGFIVALSGVSPEGSTSVENIAPMVATLIMGMSIALYTTLVGAIFHVWLMIGHRILMGGTMHLYNAIVEFGEHRVGA
jgi:hypothetical protein